MDARFHYLKQALSSEWDVKMFSSTVWDEKLKNKINHLQPKVIFLPIQALAVETLFELPKSCEVLFIGKNNDAIEQEIKKMDIHTFYYLEDEQWIWDNANFTAEGLINYFYTHEKQAIYNKKFIITGYGRVGKRLAYALHHLGASVIIAVRSEHQLYEAKSYGFQIEALENLLTNQKDNSAYLINTIPFKWLRKSGALNFNKVYDLASDPGCLLESDEQIPTNYAHALSLPGMYFPRDAGYLIAQAVQTFLTKLKGE